MKLRPPRYLVTGATGFLGRHVLAALERGVPGASVVAPMRRPETWAEMDWTADHARVRILQGGIRDRSWWTALTGPDSDAAGPIDGIFHLAAIVQHSRHGAEIVYETNIDGTLAMVELAAKLGCRLVFVSTSGTVGCSKRASDSPDEHARYATHLVRGWPYYHSKILAEQAALQRADELGVELTMLRPPVLLGPGDHRYRSTGHITRYIRGKMPFRLPGGMHFIDIRDAADAIVAAMRVDDPRPVYHLAGLASSLDGFFEIVRDLTGVPMPPRKLPATLAVQLARAADKAAHGLPGKPSNPLPDPVVVEMATHYWGLSSRYAKAELGYESRDPVVTVRETIEWLSAHHPKLARAA